MLVHAEKAVGIEEDAAELQAHCLNADGKHSQQLVVDQDQHDLADRHVNCSWLLEDSV